MSAARPPEGTHTAAKGEGTPVDAARPPEGTHTVAEGEGTPVGAPPVIEVRQLRVLFPTRDRSQTVKAVDGVSFDVRAGETFGIIGESGSGKTTLGRALVALVAPTEGVVLHGGIDPWQLARAALQTRRRDYQIVFQDPHSALDPRLRIIDSTLEPLQASGGKDRPARRRAALDALARVGLSEEMAQRYPHQLSGGQKQRANIARVLTLRPKVIVCDEVVAALDVSIRGAILNLFADLQREFGLTYVFITHDLSVVAHISDRIAVMYLGRFMELGPNQSLTRQPMHPYTAALLSAEPVALPAHLRALRPRRITLEGEMPSPIDPPSGCRLRTRCPWASARCAAEAPALRELRPQHWVACHWATAAGPPAGNGGAAAGCHRPGTTDHGIVHTAWETA
ncbi:ABC transporter ATP-binding protein [Verminephrobacter eiseniae]|uniref:ABC transporter ATP-binding protein n=1 Tax=Verminephrobacter eiseniae TaxID=364317 RepID=UPI0022386A45|nr:oligopeptide/dipeptide ABC transporter ATP-binding protein [Verminephrobacter eiseniae]